MEYNSQSDKIEKSSIKDQSSSIEVSEYKKNFPQYLCRTCGRCCKSIATSYKYDYLKQLSEEGEEEADVFINIFKKFDSIDDAKKVVPEQIEQILSIYADSGEKKPEEIDFYYCPHIKDNGLCGIYEKRPDCCRRAPNHGWSAMPPGCGFEGWQFEQREYHKQLVRSLKEFLYRSEMTSPDGKVPGKDMTLDELRASLEKKFSSWKKFGSEFW